MVLQNNGIVRSFDNLGDRVLVKNLRSKDGTKYSVGRFIKVEFDATPSIMKMVDAETRKSEEVLRVNTNKMRESEYLDRVMKRLNSELSPFRDKSTFDADYIRAMWTKYTQLEALRTNASEKQIANDLPKVAAFVKTL